MTEKEFQTILIQVRDEYLLDIKAKGFWYREEYRHDPLPWDINNGLCEDFAEKIHKLISEAEPVDIVTFEGHPTDVDANNDLALEFSHIWILWNGKHYDAECVEGVKNFRELPFFGVNPRPESARKELVVV